MQNRVTVGTLIDFLIKHGDDIDRDYELVLSSDSGVDQSLEGRIVIEDIFVNHNNKTFGIYANIREEKEDELDDNR